MSAPAAEDPAPWVARPEQGPGRRREQQRGRVPGQDAAQPTASRAEAPDGWEDAVEVEDLDAVVREHLPGLLRYAAALTGDREVAADVVQEVLVRAHSRWRRIGLLERPDLYLRRMVTNEHLSWRRRWHVRTIRPAPDEVLAARATPLVDHAERIVEHDALQRSLARLSPRQRSVLVLRFYEGLDDAEIATVLGTSRATVRSHASHALAALRAHTGADRGTP